MSGAPTPRLISIQVGLPEVHGIPGAEDPLDQPWRTGFYKAPVQGRIKLTTTNLAGDGQANLKVHGGPDKAVLGYAAEHYPAWRQELGMQDLPFGAFGENFTISLLSEGNVCLGDVYAVGTATLQVSQPRQPCANITHRWKRPGLTERVRATGRHGWYLRVLEEGEVEAGDVLTLLDRPCPEWSITRAFAVMSLRAKNPAQAARLARVPALSESWRRQLEHQR